METLRLVELPLRFAFCGESDKGYGAVTSGKTRVSTCHTGSNTVVRWNARQGGRQRTEGLAVKGNGQVFTNGQVLELRTPRIILDEPIGRQDSADQGEDRT
jgi:hypothetical protein